ncbi:MAG: CooT family nickel-binding protein [Chloroflexota bacterium]
MCEANAYLLEAKGETEIMKEVDFMDVQGDYVLFRDLLGKQKKVKGRVRTVNFAEHKILVEKAR